MFPPRRRSPSVDKRDTSGVVAPPPLIYLAALVIGVTLHYLIPTPFIPRGLAHGLGAAFILIALSVLFWGVRTMRYAGTSVSTRAPTKALVTAGPFRFSRNPLYMSLTLLYLGVAFATRSLWALVLLVVVLTVVQRGVIEREEQYLERKFGADYLRYKEHVRRWL